MKNYEKLSNILEIIGKWPGNVLDISVLLFNIEEQLKVYDAPVCSSIALGSVLDVFG